MSALKRIALTMASVTVCLAMLSAIGTMVWLCWDHLVVGVWPQLEPNKKLYGGIFTMVLTVVIVSVIVFLAMRHHRLVAENQRLAGERQRLAGRLELHKLATERDERRIVRALWEPLDFCHNPLIPSACISIIKLHLLSYYKDVAGKLQDAGGALHGHLAEDSNPTPNSAEGHRRAADFALILARGQLDNAAAWRLLGEFQELQPVARKSLDICEDVRRIYDCLNKEEVMKDDSAAEQAIGDARKGAAQLLDSLGEFRQLMDRLSSDVHTDAVGLRTNIISLSGCAPDMDVPEADMAVPAAMA